MPFPFLVCRMEQMGKMSKSNGILNKKANEDEKQEKS